jgi:SAM-dependent methyltransferase
MTVSDRRKVKKFVALEPNKLMHSALRARASDAKFYESDGSLLILPYEIQELFTKLQTDVGFKRDMGDIDTVLSILVLCNIPEPELSITRLVEYLKPGGSFLFLEHVRSGVMNAAWWQDFWAPIWCLFFDGCNINRPTHKWVQKVGTVTEGAEGSKSVWKEESVFGDPDEPESNLFWHRAGVFLKA